MPNSQIRNIQKLIGVEFLKKDEKTRKSWILLLNRTGLPPRLSKHGRMLGGGSNAKDFVRNQLSLRKLNPEHCKVHERIAETQKCIATSNTVKTVELRCLCVAQKALPVPRWLADSREKFAYYFGRQHKFAYSSCVGTSCETHVLRSHSTSARLSTGEYRQNAGIQF